MKTKMKMLSILLCVMMLVSLIPPTTAFASTVMRAEINNIDLPVIGEKPDFSAELGSLSGVMKITKVDWVEYDADWEWQKDMTTNDTFKEGYWYVVYAYLETEPGHNFGNSVSGTINSTNARMVDNTGSKVGFYVSYQAAKKLTVINYVDLTVVKPIIGKTPTFAKVDTAQYVSEKYGTVSNCSNGVTWTNQSSGVNITVSNPFKEGTKYKVTYYLTAKDGYRFDYNTKCTVNGVTATLERIDTTHITVSLGDIVPDDGKKEVSSVSIYVTAPKDGEKPNYTKINGEGYYTDNGSYGVSTKIFKNGIAWYKSASSYISPGTTETFNGGSEYTVKLSLIPKDGYKFGTNVTAKINGNTATVEKMNDGGITISIKLTALNKEHTHTDSAWKNDAASHWKVCTDAKCGVVTVAKEAHKDANKDNKCDVCSYLIPVETEKTEVTTVPQTTGVTGPAPVETTNTAESTTDTPEQTTGSNNETTSAKSKETTGTPETDGSDVKNDDDNGPVVWIILVVALVLVAGAVVAFVVLKKKKATK